MPVRHPLPDSVIDCVMGILRARSSCDGKGSSKLWFGHMLGQACRHVEYFVTPLTSVAAERAWLSASGTPPLNAQRYKKPSQWKQGTELYFEHAVPANDLKLNLLALGAALSKDAVRNVLQQAEIIWIHREEEVRLRDQLRLAPKGLRADWRKLYKLAGIDVLDPDRPLQGEEFTAAYVADGSEAPVRDHRMQPFDAETAETFGRPPRTTAAAISAFLGGASERQVPR